MSDRDSPEAELREALLLEEYADHLRCGDTASAEKLLELHPELAEAAKCLAALEGLALLAEGAAEHAQSESPATATTVLDSPTAASPFDAFSAEGSFGDYELLREIGRGGMGVVYLARQKSLGRVVALKMVLGGRWSSNAMVDRFHGEARLAAGLRHPHIIRVHEAGQLHGQHYLVMEYVDGRSLDRLLDEGPLPPEVAARHVATIARAVAYLHSEGVVHRDLKPSNILVDSQGHLYVTDFGLAKLIDAADPLTRTGELLGTASYMSPEQAACRTGEIGPASDIYSLGAILYHLLTGRPPHYGEGTFDVLLQVIEREPELPRSLNPRIPRTLEQICLKCLEKASDNRYATAEALAEDLERFLRDEPVEARAGGWASRMMRWARREPALATRLGALGGFVLLEMFDYHVLSQWFGTLQHYTLEGFHLPMLGLAAAWAIASIAFQQWLERAAHPTVVRACWIACDVAMLVVGLCIADGVASGLIAVYPLLIVASGLWSQLRLVWFTTVLAVLTYSALAIDFHARRADLQAKYDLAFDRHLAFVVAMIVIGATVAHLVRRLRSLSRYFEYRRTI